MNMRSRHIFVCWFLLMLLIPTLVFAQGGNALSRIVKAGELRVGTSGAQPPFTAKAKNGSLMGFEIDLAHFLAESMGVKVTFVEIPFPDLLPSLSAGKVDIVMSGMTITPERNISVAFAGPYLVSGKSILTHSSRADALDEQVELNRKSVTVAVLRNSTSQRFVERFMPRATVVKVENHEAAITLVLSKRADLMVADFPFCALSMMRHPEADLAILDEPLTIEPIGVAMQPDSFQLHNLIANYVGALKMTGMLDDLEAQWFASGDWLIRLP